MKKILGLTLLFLTAALPAWGATLGLMSKEQSMKSLSELITATLPPELQLLERDELAKLETELQLQQDWDISGVEAARRIANLESADLLAILHAGDGDGAATITVFDRASGIRLRQARLPERELALQAEHAIAVLNDALARQEGLRNQSAIALSFLPPSYLDVTPEAEPFVRKSHALLVEAVAARPGVVVLERDFLTMLLREPGWYEKAGIRTLLAGALLLHVEVNRGRSGNEQWYTLSIMRPEVAEPLLQYDFFLDGNDTGREWLEDFATRLHFPAAEAAGTREQEGKRFAAQAFAGALQNRLEEALSAALQAEMLDDDSRESITLEAQLALTKWRESGRETDQEKRRQRQVEVLEHFAAASERALRWGVEVTPLRTLARQIGGYSAEAYAGLAVEHQQLLRDSYLRYLNGFFLTPLAISHRELAAAKSAELKLDILREEAALLRELPEWTRVAWEPELAEKYCLEAWRSYNADCAAAFPALQEAVRQRAKQQRLESKMRDCSLMVERLPEEWGKRLAEEQLENVFYENALEATWELSQRESDPAERAKGVRKRLRMIFERKELLPMQLPPQLRIVFLRELLQQLPMVQQLEIHDLVFRRIRGYNPLRELELPEGLRPAETRAIYKAVTHWGKNCDEAGAADHARRLLTTLETTYPELKIKK